MTLPQTPNEKSTPLVAAMDCVAWLKTLAPRSVDLIVTDPAYESLEKHRKVGTTTRLTNEWFEIFPNSRFPELFLEFWRVLKSNAHLYVYCDTETLFVIKGIAEAHGFRFWKPLVWDKVHIGMGYHYRARYEWVAFFEKGKQQLNDLSVADIITCKRVRGGYPTEKPVAVSGVLVDQSSNPGELVIDPFAGSGSVGVAAVTADRRFLGADISASAAEAAARRIEEATT